MSKVTLSLFAFVAATAAILSSNSTSDYKILSFLKDVQQQEHFRSIFVLKKSNNPFVGDLVKGVSDDLPVPLIVISDSSSFFLKNVFNNNILVIVHLESITDEDTLNQLLQSLRHIRSSKTIFLLDYPSRAELILRRLFNFCWDSHMINVLAVFQDFANTSTYYRYTNMPTFSIEEQIWMEKGPPTNRYFPDRMRDLKGLQLPVLFAGSEPKMIISKNNHGRPTIGGYAGHLFLAMAKKHNANLSSPQINKALAARNLTNLVYNGTVDMSAATVYMTPYDWCSYPYENFDWCLMLPIEPTIPIYKIFTIIFKWYSLLMTFGVIVIASALLATSSYLLGRRTSLLNYFIQDSCLRGCLGQSFIEIPRASYTIKIIYLVVCFIGIIVVTSYDAFLQTYMYSPPSEKKIESFDELLASGMKVYGLSSEFIFLTKMSPNFTRKYKALFEFEDDFAVYVEFRDSFNTSFAYMVNDPKWIILQEQQRLSGHLVFRQLKDVCFLTTLPMAFPINENSIYKEILNFLILETYSSGLLDFWKRRAFNELIAIGKIKHLSFSWKSQSVPLNVEDFQLIWMGMGISFVAALFCFVGEIFIFKYKAQRRR